MTAVYAAIVAALASIVGTLVTAFLTRQNFKVQKNIEMLKTEQQGILAQKNALTSYEFEARKRLYTDCEPIFFQIEEAAEDALRQLCRICKPDTCEKFSPVKQNLDSNPDEWMLTRSSELIATYYALFAPLALFCLLREHLTSADFSLDKKVWFRYRLARELYESFQDDTGLANCDPPFVYNPAVKEWRKKRLENPREHWWQGLTRGRLDRAARLLIIRENGIARLMTFGEFEDLYEKTYKDSDIVEARKTIGVAANALYGFTPYHRPVFWRVIMVQLHLHRGLARPPPDDVDDLLKNPDKLREFLTLEDYQKYNWSQFDWSDHGVPASITKSPDDAHRVALDYLVGRLAVRPAAATVLGCSQDLEGDVNRARR